MTHEEQAAEINRLNLSIEKLVKALNQVIRPGPQNRSSNSGTERPWVLTARRALAEYEAGVRRDGSTEGD